MDFTELYFHCMFGLKVSVVFLSPRGLVCCPFSGGDSVVLSHLSRGLMDELIVYQSLRRPSSVRPKFQTSSPLKPLGQLNSNFTWRLLKSGNESLFKWSWSHDQDGRHAHIWYKPFTNLLLQNKKADDLGTWYVALGMWGLPSLFK